MGTLLRLHHRCSSSSTIRCANSLSSTTTSSRPWAHPSSIFRFMDAQDEVRERPRARTSQGVPRKRSGLKTSASTTRNEEGEHQILHDIDLDVRAGEVVALVGPSGAGKSTLVNLIPRFFDVTCGPHPHRRPRPARSQPRLAAPPDRQGHAGDDPLQRHGAQQHRLRPAGCDA